jgi:hypothetical protein
MKRFVVVLIEYGPCDMFNSVEARMQQSRCFSDMKMANYQYARHSLLHAEKVVISFWQVGRKKKKK